MAINSRKEQNDFYNKLLFDAEWEGPGALYSVMRTLAKRDLFFLLTRVLKRHDIQHDWLWARCREFQANPNGYLDLWAREHRKSTIITFAYTIQDILWDPEITIAILSFARPLAKDFLNQIKEELQHNQLLKDLFPDILYQQPEKEAPRWSLDYGIVVRRKTNPKESTVEAHGLTDALPTGNHYHVRVYDDIIDEKNVTSADMILKSIDRWELSLNLGSDRICPRYGRANIERYVGTKYKLNDPYREIEKREAAIVRKHPGTIDGRRNSPSVYFTEELMEEKRRKMGAYTFACQILLDPKADALQSFHVEWLRYWVPDNWGLMNRYIVVDPASKRKKTSDYTCLWVIGLAEDMNYYLIAGVNDRMSLTQRADKLFELHRKYRPQGVGYEEYGAQADIEHIEDRMEREHYRFEITPLGGGMPKEDRIGRLVPLFEYHRIFLPVQSIFVDYEGKTQCATKMFVNQYESFPATTHDDSLDCVARILDDKLSAVFPEPKDEIPTGIRQQGVDYYDPFAELHECIREQRQKEANEYRPFAG